MQIAETRTAKIHLDENNILHIVLHANTVVDYEDAMDNTLIVKSLTNGEPCFKLIDVRGDITFTVEAKFFLDTKDVQGKTIVRAILVDSGVKRVTFNFFELYNSRQIPTKFFKEEKEAIEWLKQNQRIIVV